LYEKVKTEAAKVREELLADVDRRQLLAVTDLLEALNARIEATPR